VLAVVGAIGSFNLVVDPFNRLGLNRTGVYASTERDAKPHMITWYPHNAVLLGSSKMAYVDPERIDSSEYRFFNAALSAGLPEEMLNFVELYVREEKLVVLEVDLFMMNEAWGAFTRRADTFKRGSVGEELVRLMDYLFSWRIALKSFEALQLARDPQGVTFLQPSGVRNAGPDLKVSNALSAPDYTRPLQILEAATYGNFTYSEQRLGDLRQIRGVLERRGIQYVVIVPPTNRQVLELIERLPKARSALARFRIDVKDIFPRVIDYSDSRFSADEYYFRQDPFHFLPDTGAEVLTDALARNRAGAARKPRLGAYSYGK
jgi:hypothetical protein